MKRKEEQAEGEQAEASSAQTPKKARRPTDEVQKGRAKEGAAIAQQQAAPKGSPPGENLVQSAPPTQQAAGEEEAEGGVGAASEGIVEAGRIEFYYR